MNAFRFQTVIVMFLILVMSSGCAQIKDKFIRKPKDEEVDLKRYRAVRTYDVQPSIELYQKRYVLWKVWHKELLSVLRDSNHKKKIIAIDQEISNLVDMRNMLTKEKGEELQKIIVQMMDIQNMIKRQKVATGNEVRIRVKLEALGRQIKGDFNYNKVQDFIGSDFAEYD
ncbi:MAG: hypothetical protein ABIH85_03255 [Candidatus Omnitrophota bacterium]|nr:hypothetical protein [Candidatus Omnitrophota bacterium]